MAEAKVITGAVFDDTKKYRYRLWRRWNSSLPSVCMILLNPTSLGIEAKDPALDRCAALAKKWGFGAIEVVNLFAFRAVRQSDLWHVDDPVGPHNDQHIKRAVGHCKTCVVAWGNLPIGRLDRAKSVLSSLADKDVYCLGVTRLGQPRHPLFIGAFSDDYLGLSLLPYEAPMDLEAKV